jgi:hypothetical protein
MLYESVTLFVRVIMPRICPSCGYQAYDDQSLFCNKCGYPFPQNPPEKREIVKRTDNHVPAIPANPRGGERDIAGTSQKRSRYEKTGRGGFFSFTTFIARDYITIIYIAGAAVIILVSLLGISAGFSKPGTGAVNMSFTNTTALAENFTGSPLFWIGFLIFGSLIWRMFCEMVVVMFRMHDALSSGVDTLFEDETTGYSDEMTQGYGGNDATEYVKCPRCFKIVPVDQMRECEHCGVQGCSNCIRMLGLLKKTMTCKECFEKK